MAFPTYVANPLEDTLYGSCRPADFRGGAPIWTENFESRRYNCSFKTLEKSPYVCTFSVCDVSCMPKDTETLRIRGPEELLLSETVDFV